MSDFSQLSGLSVVLLPIWLQGSTLLLLLQEGTVVWVLWPIKHGPSVRREQNDACVHFHLIPYRAKLLSHLTFLHIWIPRSQTFFIVPYLKVLLSILVPDHFKVSLWFAKLLNNDVLNCLSIKKAQNLRHQCCVYI